MSNPQFAPDELLKVRAEAMVDQTEQYLADVALRGAEVANHDDFPAVPEKLKQMHPEKIMSDDEHIIVRLCRYLGQGMASGVPGLASFYYTGYRFPRQ